VQLAPGIPCALYSRRGETILQTSGASRREIAEPHLKFDVIASEAKQSISPRKRKNGLLRRFAPRNDGLRIGCFKIESI
jgi:hypothetical protein